MAHASKPTDEAAAKAAREERRADIQRRLDEAADIMPGPAAYFQVSPSLMRRLGVGYRRAYMPGWKSRGTPGRRNR